MSLRGGSAPTTREKCKPLWSERRERTNSADPALLRCMLIRLPFRYLAFCSIHPAQGRARTFRDKSKGLVILMTPLRVLFVKCKHLDTL
jgi:hypothetical protein